MNASLWTPATRSEMRGMLNEHTLRLGSAYTLAERALKDAGCDSNWVSLRWEAQLEERRNVTFKVNDAERFSAHETSSVRTMLVCGRREEVFEIEEPIFFDDTGLEGADRVKVRVYKDIGSSQWKRAQVLMRGDPLQLPLLTQEDVSWARARVERNKGFGRLFWFTRLVLKVTGDLLKMPNSLRRSFLAIGVLCGVLGLWGWVEPGQGDVFDSVTAIVESIGILSFLLVLAGGILHFLGGIAQSLLSPWHFLGGYFAGTPGAKPSSRKALKQSDPVFAAWLLAASMCVLSVMFLRSTTPAPGGTVPHWEMSQPHPHF